jgi:hypothetical protein
MVSSGANMATTLCTSVGNSADLYLRQFEEQSGDCLWGRHHRIMTGG